MFIQHIQYTIVNLFFGSTHLMFTMTVGTTQYSSCFADKETHSPEPNSHGQGYIANNYVLKYSQCSFQHTILLLGHEKKNWSIFTRGDNLKIIDAVDILYHRGKKEPIFYSALLIRVEFRKSEYLRNMMLSIIDFLLVLLFLRLSLMVSNHFDKSV